MAGEPSPQFSQRLRQLREAAGLTQEQLAERAGLSVKAVSALERGERRRPYPHTVRALADALDLSPEARAELARTVPAREREPRRAEPVTLALPEPPTALIGREREVSEILALLSGGDVRMVTLTGAGGVGKTRLALEVASQAGGATAGVAFVPLAQLGDPALVLPAIARSLGVADLGATPAVQLIANHVDSDPWLLVLDNLEQVLDAAPLLADLLASVPGLTILATSRAPVRIRAEYEYPVRPLPIPDLSHIPLLDEVADIPSVQLFVERGRAASPRFDITQENCAAVAAICRRLDGLPLALELVAARMRALSPTELLARLDRMLPLLVGGSRDLPQRQQTMRSAIDWSHDLLDPSQQTLFRRLAAFAGGWTLDAAESVTGWGVLEPETVVDHLGSLVEQSLVVAEDGPDGATRYRMLEPIRHYAAQRLAESGEREDACDRHLTWCLALARQAARELVGPGQQAWLETLEREHDNIRAALRWGQDRQVTREPALELAASLWRFWAIRGHLTEGRRWLDALLASAGDVAPRLRADASNAAGNLARDQGDLARSAELHEHALALRREIGDQRGIALSLNNIGTVRMDQGAYDEGRKLYEQALALFRALDGEWEVAIALHNIGVVLGVQGEADRAVASLEEAIDIWTRLGETASLARSIDGLAEVHRRAGRLDRAAALHDEALRIWRELGNTRATGVTLKNLGIVARYRGDLDAAERLLDESLVLRERIGDTRGIAVCLAALADVARLAGDAEGARARYLEALALQRRVGTTEGAASCLFGLAAVAAADGHPVDAARLLGASDALRESAREAVHPIDLGEYRSVREVIRAALPADDFAAAVDAGRKLLVDAAIDPA